MSYLNHFQHADDIIAHLDTFVPASPHLLQAKYIGFVTVSAATVYELAVKEIFIDFAQRKHKVLGNFTENFFYRINGRIKIADLRNDYIKKFGQKYLTKFDKIITKEKTIYFQSNQRMFDTAYSNLITWRHDFAHEGRINAMSTYQETVQSYKDGKEVIRCLALTMSR